MGFSVDYEFVDGQPDKSAIYRWVIEKADCQTLKKPIQLGSQGTLMGFIPHLRPNKGPFHTHIEDQRGVRLSKSLLMR